MDWETGDLDFKPLDFKVYLAELRLALGYHLSGEKIGINDINYFF